MNSESEGKEELQVPRALELVWAWHGGPRRTTLPSRHLAGTWPTHLLWPLGQHWWVLTAHLAHLHLPEEGRP